MTYLEIGNVARNFYCFNENDRFYSVVKSRFLETIIKAYKPFVLKKLKHYNMVTEDMKNEAYLKIIQLCLDFDKNKLEPAYFSWYIVQNLDYFFKDKLKEKIKYNNNFINAPLDENRLKVEDKYFFEREDILSNLKEKERIIVKEHILNNVSLKDLSSSLGISYSYGKKLKKRALDKLRTFLEI